MTTPDTLNLGILAHIDAGKTSLTERLLFDNGAVPELGSVDAGSTRTDSGELERERGITIRSAVAAFALRGGDADGAPDLQVNLVDTPGHPDFIAEVERALSVLDGAVVVLSAVEGVQAQTRVLMRSLRKLKLPTLIFVNKIDRMGARPEGLLADVRSRLAPHIVPMGTVADPGTAAARATARSFADPEARVAAAEVLAEQDDDLLARLVDGSVPSEADLREVLLRQTAAGQVHPVYFGSALTGEGTRELADGIRTLLRPPVADPGAPADGTVFAVERTPAGEKVAYLRLFSGRVHEREQVVLRRRGPGGAEHTVGGRVTGLQTVRPPGSVPGRSDDRSLTAGSIARVRGLSAVQVGDRIGDRTGAGDRSSEGFHFAPPGLETVVRPERPDQKALLHAALLSLADEDPLIRTRPAAGGATSVLLYGAVQREVVAERLRRDFGVAPVFEPITPVHVERPVGTGEARIGIERGGGHDFWATVALRVEPAPIGSGVRFVDDTEWGALPQAFHRAVDEAVLRCLEQGLYGWEVTDCTVTLTEVGYTSPVSTAADFRNLTPMVLLRALRAAGSRVFEPGQAVEIEVPPDLLGGVVGLLGTLGADIGRSVQHGTSWLIGAELPAQAVQQLTAALPGLTRGEGALWSGPGADRPVHGPAPLRERFDGNPLDRIEYLRFLADRSLVRTIVTGQ
ncbi:MULTISPECIES: GTP-binding protein [Streptacidiphilus]|uniref:GTP-binding protein n=1 Tax=Streptacidiphilus cavernicola TaxID=3342716 RepID=A0ABV6UZD8_9ACTN|nr:GTP-binding protein [Streptacidiphilus jeojiense]